MQISFSAAVMLYSAVFANASNGTNATSQCYSVTLPALTASSANRTVPWGSPALVLSNGTTCCDSLDEVRAGIDDVDTQLLSLLALRYILFSDISNLWLEVADGR